MFAFARSVPKGVALARNAHVIASAPLNRVGLPIKLVHMALISGALLGVPMYVAVNFKHYRGE